MSEYQYYEFRAIDRPLTGEEMEELREISSRAEITPTSFVNIYNYADFRGEPLELMERYHDFFIYVTNWGTRQLMFRLPRHLFDPELARPYLVEQYVQVHQKGESVILDLLIEDEDAAGWEDGEGYLGPLLPLREDLASGDLRPLYLAWLACAGLGILEDDAPEPPVPPGLLQLSPALHALAEFLFIDEPLLVTAASQAPAAAPARDSAELERWLRALPTVEKDTLLLRLIEQRDPHVRSEILHRFHDDHPPTSAGSRTTGRTVSDLLAASQD